MKTLLLWDIDGTLLSSGGSGVRALETGLKNAFGLDRPLDGIDYAGRTDRWIMRQIFGLTGLPATEENFTRLSESYFAALPAELDRGPVRVLPGVRALLETAASRPHIAQGLLTGNLRRGAEIKLGHQNLWHHFAFGGFADDAELRNDITPHAVRRAHEHHRVTFQPRRIIVIGDTPHDIACGRVVGARTLALATGGYSQADLRAHAPDALMADLSDAEAFWTFVDAE